MSTVLDTGIIVGSGKHSVHTGSKVNFLSASGNSLMTVTETAQVSKINPLVFSEYSNNNETLITVVKCYDVVKDS